MADPFEALRSPIVPIDPDLGFADRLRARIEQAMNLPEGATMSTCMLTPHPGATDLPAPATGVVPYLAVADAPRALAWYAGALGARARGEPVIMPDGRIGHAELELAGGLVTVADEHPGIGFVAPGAGRGPPSRSTFPLPTSTDWRRGRSTRGRPSSARQPTIRTGATPSCATPSATAG